MFKRFCIIFLLLAFCSSGENTPTINSENQSTTSSILTKSIPVFNAECSYSLQEALNSIYQIAKDNQLAVKVNWIEVDSSNYDEKCLNKVVGSNLPQGAIIENNSKVELAISTYREPVKPTINETTSSSEVSKDGILPGIVDVYEGAELIDFVNTEAVVTDIESNQRSKQLLIAMKSKEYIYFYNNQTKTVEPLFRFTKNIDTSEWPSTEGGIVKIQIIDDKYLLVAYHNKNMEVLIKQFNLLEKNIADSVKIIYKEKLIESVHHCIDMEYDSTNRILYFCRGDSTMEIDLIAQQPHLYDGKIHRFSFSEVNGLTPIQINSDQNDFVKVFPNTYPKKLESIYAIGLRNPYQIHLSEDGVLYIPDVGEGYIEELNVIKVSDVKKIVNFGWPFFDGTDQKDVDQEEMSPSEYRQFIDNLKLTQTEPFIQYRHEDTPSGYRCAIIGGTTYQGQKSNAWKNKYLFADYCTGEVMTLFGDYPNFRVLKLIQLSKRITAIKNDLDGEILIAVELDPGSSDDPGIIYQLKLP